MSIAGLAATFAASATASRNKKCDRNNQDVLHDVHPFAVRINLIHKMAKELVGYLRMAG